MGEPDNSPVVANLGRVLGVWAHPDDETYLSGGLMAQAASAGQRVVCVTATRGEGGSLDEERWPPSRLAEIRTRELAEAFAHLGVTEHVWLDYPDGGCAEVDVHEAVARLLPVLDDVTPDTVLTFGPDGLTGHADHRAVSRWVDVAVGEWVAQGRTRPRVLHAAETHDFWELVKDVFEPFNVYMGFTPTRIRPEDAAVVLYVEEPWLSAKVAAIRAQESQTSALFAAMGDDLARRAMVEEVFVDG